MPIEIQCYSEGKAHGISGDAEDIPKDETTITCPHCKREVNLNTYRKPLNWRGKPSPQINRRETY